MDRWHRVLSHYLWIGLAVTLAAPTTANAASDPLLSRQWALADPAAVGAQEAWTQSDGSGVVVALLDTGVQLDHPDLAGSIWTNPHEIPGNGRDDDDNGIVDDVHGANMLGLNADVNDDNGHGTHDAGIIAARRGNGIGGSGLAPGATIMPVKVLDGSLRGTTNALARGIVYAVVNGAKILNVSVNTDVATEPVADAVRFAGSQGAIIVASAGNNGRDIDVAPSYPASLPDAAILSVAANTDDGILSTISNRGAGSVDLAAPGERILSTATGSGYQWRTGTSAAAPFVSASLALLSAARPDLPMSALRDALTATTRRSGILTRALHSGGRLDVGSAMHRVVSGSWSASPAATGEPELKLRTRKRTRSGSKVTLRWTGHHTGEVARWRVSLDGRVWRSVSARHKRVSRRIRRTGRHNWRVVGYDKSGHKVVAARRHFRIVHRRSS